jgi:hypothetical protein
MKPRVAVWGEGGEGWGERGGGEKKKCERGAGRACEGRLFLLAVRDGRVGRGGGPRRRRRCEQALLYRTTGGGGGAQERQRARARRGTGKHNTRSLTQAGARGRGRGVGCLRPSRRARAPRHARRANPVHTRPSRCYHPASSDLGQKSPGSTPTHGPALGAGGPRRRLGRGHTRPPPACSSAPSFASPSSSPGTRHASAPASMARRGAIVECFFEVCVCVWRGGGALLVLSGREKERSSPSRVCAKGQPSGVGRPLFSTSSSLPPPPL